MADRTINLIYLHSHDTGRRISPYGYAVDTPRLHRLAGEGVMYRKAFCAAPTCSPSRAALLTGQSAHSSGMLGLNHRGFELAHPERHLANVLKNAGYSTALAGVNHVASDAARIGYERVLRTDTARAEHVAPAAAAFLRERGATGGGPFYLDCGFVETHRGQFAPHDERDEPRFQQPPAGIAQTPETRLDTAHFASAARRFDAGVGQVLDAVDDAGLAEDTLIVCTTDHGISFPGYKCRCSDGGMETMLILRGPGGSALPGGFGPRTSGGQACDALTSQIDLFPTICDVLQIPPPPWLQGKSLLPVLRAERAEVNDAIFAEVTYHAAYEPMRAVRTDRWKYVRRFGARLRPVAANLDDGLSKDLWLANGYLDRELPEEQLHDLLFDPTEADNLAARPEHAAVLAELRGRLDRWMRETDDPLLDGPVPLPPGCFTNGQDDLSASPRAGMKK